MLSFLLTRPCWARRSPREPVSDEGGVRKAPQAPRLRRHLFSGSCKCPSLPQGLRFPAWIHCPKQRKDLAVVELALGATELK